MKTYSKLVSAGLLSMAALAAHAQTLSPGNPKVLRQTLSATLGSYTTVEVTDTTFDPADPSGDRYITGRAVLGTNTDGFVAKLDRQGRLLWSNVISLGGNEFGKAVAVDSTGNVFVAVNQTTNLPGKLQKYGPTGTLLWTQTCTYSAAANDLIITPAGAPISVGTYNLTQLFVVKWDPTGPANSPAAGYIYWGLDGSFTNAALAPNGSIFMAGKSTYTPEGGAAQPDQPTVGMISNDLVAASITRFTGTGPGNAMNSIVVDANNRAISTGYIGATHRPFSIIVTGAYTAGGTPPITLTAGYIYLSYDAVGGAEFQSAQVGADGTIYYLVNRGVNTGPRKIDVRSFTHVLATNVATAGWTKSLPDAGVTTNLTGFDLLLWGDNLTVAALDERTVGTPSYQAYNLFTYSTAGTPIHRSVLGKVETPIPATYVWSSFPVDNLTFAGDRLNLFAPIAGDQTGAWAAGSVDGPEDRYVTTKNVPVVQSEWKGSLLENDRNAFVEGLTSVLTPDSLVNLASVTVNPDGTFTATPVAGFAGEASFQYDVMSGATKINTVTAHVKVKNDKVPPVAVDDAFTFTMNEERRDIDVLANDYDPGLGELTIVSRTTPEFGVCSVDPGRKKMTFKPKKNWTGTVTFTYKIKNPAGNVATGTVTITVEQPV